LPANIKQRGVVPFIAIPLALIASRSLHRLDVWLGWSLLGFETDGAKTLLEAFVTVTLSFVVFTFAIVAMRSRSDRRPRMIGCILAHVGNDGIPVIESVYSPEYLNRAHYLPDSICSRAA